MTDTKPERQTAEERFATLSELEIYWSDKYEWLQTLGYRLRPRFRPGWVASWKSDPKLILQLCEDHLRQHGNVCDAERIADGTQVMLKSVDMRVFRDEVAIMKFLNEEPQRSDSRNHCVPLLDILVPPNEPDRNIIVMPVCSMWDDPDFDTIGEVVDCIRQLLEGVQFLHAHRIAHGDFAYGNLMMDAGLFTVPFHPFDPEERLDFTGKSKPRYTRTQHRTKYYIIDFGISCRYEESEMPPSHVTGIFGSDRSVPEFAFPNAPHNPFLIDIYCVGNLIRHYILWQEPEQLGFSWIVPLLGDMMNPDPEKRPSMDEVLSRYNESVRSLTTTLLRSRWSRAWNNMAWYEKAVEGLPHLARKMQYIITRTPPIPT